MKKIIVGRIMGRLISCIHCGLIHDSEHICKAKQIRKNSSRKNDIDISKFRNKIVWQKKREYIRVRDEGMCVYCRRVEQVMTTGVEVHHITPMKEGRELWLDNDNLITLCIKHHKLAEYNKISRDTLRGLIR